MLLASGADLQARTNDGKTALTFAQERGHAEVAAFLRSNGSRKRVQEMSAHRKIAVLFDLFVCICLSPSGKSFAKEKGGTMSLQISSAAFLLEETIPKKIYLRRT